MQSIHQVIGGLFQMIAASPHSQIRQKLKSSEADILPTPIRQLARAVWNIPSDRKAHTRCRAALAALVDAEMDGELALFDASVREHILECNRCASLYVELLEISLLDLFGRLPRPSSFPSPDLSFLEALHG